MTDQSTQSTLSLPRAKPFRPGGALERKLIIALGSRHSVGTLKLILPDGAQHLFRGERRPDLSATMRVKTTRFVRRFLMRGAIGFAESYIDGDWDSPDLAQLLILLDCNRSAWIDKYHGNVLARLAGRLLHSVRRNSRSGSRRNIRAHYDLGNDFYAAWLDPTMTYSSAYFGDGAKDLHSAQLDKYRALCRRMDLRPGHKLLEIGCGWGSFAIVAASEFGAEVTAITVSKEQFELATKRVQAEGLNDKVSIHLRDYRDISGQFDRIASIEMFEAVGEAYWPAFFSAIRDRLRSDGCCGLQLITIDDAHFEEYRGGPDFIQYYIFPGGMLPSPSALRKHTDRANLEIAESHGFGLDYARTLGVWREKFDQAWQDHAIAGYDERFRRLWNYYLSYCETGFTNLKTDVVQLVLKPRLASTSMA